MIITPKTKNFKFQLFPIGVPAAVPTGGVGSPAAWVNRSGPEHWVGGRDPWSATVAVNGGANDEFSIPLDWYKGCFMFATIGGSSYIQQRYDLWTVSDETELQSLVQCPMFTIATGDGGNNADGFLQPIYMDTVTDCWKFRYWSDGLPEGFISQFWSYEYPGVILPPYFMLPPGMVPTGMY